MPIRHVILDRDGVLNLEAPHGGYVSEPQGFRWLPGALEGLARLRAAGLLVSVATNQSGVGRGIMSLAQLEAVHARMRADAQAHGGSVHAVLFCPHAPDERCACRKPQPGLIVAAVEQSGIDAAETLVVGDDLRDLDAARRAGVRAALVRTGKGSVAEALIRDPAVSVYDDLAALARAITATETDPRRSPSMSISEVFAEHARVAAQAGNELPPLLERAVATVHQSLQAGRTVFACGNGGSASDAQHLVAELVGRFRDERRALAAVALNADTATLTCLANDYGYERVFARQLEALGRKGDVLFAISTSGNSPNVLQAAQTARGLGCTVIVLTGAGGGKLAAHADLLIRAPSNVVARIQEIHTLCIHAICHELDALILQPSADTQPRAL